MTKMIMKLDTEKIEREGKYDANKLLDVLEENFTRLRLTKVADGEYEGELEYTIKMLVLISNKDWLFELMKELRVEYIENGEVYVEDALQLRAEGRI